MKHYSFIQDNRERSIYQLLKFLEVVGIKHAGDDDKDGKTNIIYIDDINDFLERLRGSSS